MVAITRRLRRFGLSLMPALALWRPAWGAAPARLVIPVEALLSSGTVRSEVPVDPVKYSLLKVEESESKFKTKCRTTFLTAQEILHGGSFGPGASERRAELMISFATDFLRRVEDLTLVGDGKSLPSDGVQKVFLSMVYANLQRDEAGRKWTVYTSSGSPVEIPDADLDVERRTSEEWRVLNAAQQRRGPSAAMAPATLDEVEKYLVFYDVVLLRLSRQNAEDAGHRRSTVGDMDAASADLHSSALDYLRVEMKPKKLANVAWLRFHAIAFAEGKAKAVVAINGDQSAEARKKHFEILAGGRLKAGAPESLQDALRGVGRLVWRRGQELMPEGWQLITGEPMAQAIGETFPYRVDESENVEFFPGGPQTVRLFAHEVDSFRSDPMWWRVQVDLLRYDLKERGAGEGALWAPMDPYAADELAELLSNVAVLILKEAVAIAARSGRLEAGAADIVAAGRSIEGRMGKLPAAAPKAEPEASRPRGAGAGRRYFQDVTSRALGPAAASPSTTGAASEFIGPFKKARGFTILDFDRDGLPDLFVCGSEAGEKNHLYHNEGGWRFKDVTEAVGDLGQNCNSASAADYDNDGWPDLVISAREPAFGGERRSLQLFHNDHGFFEDVTKRAGLPVEELSTEALGWLDYDRDGLLDLYVVCFGDKSTRALPTMGDAKNGVANRLFKNLGDGTFVDVTSTAGVGDTGWGLAAATLDFDDDGWPDLYVANDFGRSVLYRNQHDGTFRDVSRAAGVDSFGHAMGVSIGDYDNDGLPDIFVTNIGAYNSGTRYIRPNANTPLQFSIPLERTLRVREANRLYRNLGGGKFEDVYESSVGPVPTGWGWSGMFLDIDNDGFKDLYIVNGVPGLSINYYRQGQTLLRWDEGQKKFVDISKGSGADMAMELEGAAFGDFDRDGKLDMVVAGMGGVKLLRNVSDDRNGWLSLRLVGKRSNRDAIGAKVEISSGSWKRYAWVGGEGGGFSGGSENFVHFGLGSLGGIEELKVRWPSGKTQVWRGLLGRRYYEIIEDEPAPRRLSFDAGTRRDDPVHLAMRAYERFDRAVALLRRGQRDQAQVQLRQAMKAPKPSLIRMIGRFPVGDRLKLLAEMSRLAGKDADWAVETAELAMREGKRAIAEKALGHFGGAAVYHPDQAARLASLFARLGEFPKAYEVLAAAASRDVHLWLDLAKQADLAGRRQVIGKCLERAEKLGIESAADLELAASLDHNASGALKVRTSLARLKFEELGTWLARAEAAAQAGDHGLVLESLAHADALVAKAAQLEAAGDIDLQLQEPGLELKTYERLTALEPDDARARLMQARAAVKAGRSAEALKDLGRVDELASAAEDLEAAGGLYSRLNEPGLALKAYEKLTVMKPDDARAWLMRARAAVEVGKSTEALKGLDRADELGLTAADRAAAVDVYLRLKEPALALKAYEKLTALKPDDAQAWLIEARAAVEVGRSTEALRALARVDALGSAAELNAAGGLYMRLKEYRPALTCYERLTALNPDDALARLSLAQAAVEADERAKALESLTRADALGLGAADLERAGGLYMRLKEYGPALNSYERLTGLRPDDAGAWLLRAEAGAEAGEREKALGSLERAQALPGNPDQRHEIALLNQKLGRYAQALAVFEDLLRDNPGKVAWLADKGVCEYLGGQPQKAIDSLTAAIVRDPGQMAFYLSLGTVYESQKRYGEALRIFESGLSVETSPAQPEVRKLILEGRERLGRLQNIK